MADQTSDPDQNPCPGISEYYKRLNVYGNGLYADTLCPLLNNNDTDIYNELCMLPSNGTSLQQACPPPGEGSGFVEFVQDGDSTRTVRDIISSGYVVGMNSDRKAVPKTIRCDGGTLAYKDDDGGLMFSTNRVEFTLFKEEYIDFDVGPNGCIYYTTESKASSIYKMDPSTTEPTIMEYVAASTPLDGGVVAFNTIHTTEDPRVVWVSSGSADSATYRPCLVTIDFEAKTFTMECGDVLGYNGKYQQKRIVSVNARAAFILNYVDREGVYLYFLDLDSDGNIRKTKTAKADSPTFDITYIVGHRLTIGQSAFYICSYSKEEETTTTRIRKIVRTGGDLHDVGNTQYNGPTLQDITVDVYNDQIYAVDIHGVLWHINPDQTPWAVVPMASTAQVGDYTATTNTEIGNRVQWCGSGILMSLMGGTVMVHDLYYNFGVFLDLVRVHKYSSKLHGNGVISFYNAKGTLVAETTTSDGTSTKTVAVPIGSNGAVSHNGLYSLSIDSGVRLRYVLANSGALSGFCSANKNEQTCLTSYVGGYCEKAGKSHKDRRCICVGDPDIILGSVFDLGELKQNKFLYEQLKGIAPCLLSECMELREEDGIIKDFMENANCPEKIQICTNNLKIMGGSSVNAGKINVTNKCGTGANMQCGSGCPLNTKCDPASNVCKITCDEDQACGKGGYCSSAGVCETKQPSNGKKGLSVGASTAIAITAIALTAVLGWLVVKYKHKLISKYKKT